MQGYNANVSPLSAAAINRAPPVQPAEVENLADTFSQLPR